MLLLKVSYYSNSTIVAVYLERALDHLLQEKCKDESKHLL